MRPFVIHDREIGDGHPAYIIAEMSANHQQDFDLACAILDASAEAGVDAVKLQTYTADTLTVRSDELRLHEGSLWEGQSLYELYEKAATPWEWYPALRDRARDRGVHLFSSPFDATAVAFLESHGAPAYKVASFEITDLDLIGRVAATGKPTIMSTGMATLGEIDAAVRTFRERGGEELALLRCNSAYPAAPDEMDLRAITAMLSAWDVPIGLSDHTLSSTSAVISIALGATIIEKHVTLERAAGGADAAFSLEPQELRNFVAVIREAEASLGGARFGPSDREIASLAYRRSLFLVKDVRRGDVLTPEHVRSVRPALGLAPEHRDLVIGAVAALDVKAPAPVTWEMIGVGSSNADA